MLQSTFPNIGVTYTDSPRAKGGTFTFQGPFDWLELEKSQFLQFFSPRRLRGHLSRKAHVPRSPSSEPAACGEPAQAAGKGGCAEGRSPARGRSRAGDAGRGGAVPARARAGCARRRRRRRVTSVRHVPVFTSLVEQPTSAAKWQHCGDTEGYSLGDASIRQAGSGRSGRGGEGGGAGRSPWTSGGDAHIAGPYCLTGLPGPAGPAPHLPRAADAAPRPRAGGGRDGREALPQHWACKQIQPHVTM